MVKKREIALLIVSVFCLTTVTFIYFKVFLGYLFDLETPSCDWPETLSTGISEADLRHLLGSPQTSERIKTEIFDWTILEPSQIIANPAYTDESIDVYFENGFIASRFISIADPANDRRYKKIRNKLEIGMSYIEAEEAIGWKGKRVFESEELEYKWFFPRYAFRVRVENEKVVRITCLPGL